MSTETQQPRCGMKGKSIKSILRRKVDAWLKSIEVPELKERLEKGVIVTGGSIASMLLGEPVSDYDLYFRDHNTTLEVAKYYLERFKPKPQNGVVVPLSILDENGRIKIIAKSAGIAGEESGKDYHYFEGRPSAEAGEYVESVITDPEQIEETYEETEQAALQTEDKKKPYRPVFITSNAITLSDKVQLIIRFHGEPDEIHANYDFIHCTNYWKNWDGELVLRPAAMEALLSRTLQYVGSKYPICSLVRLRKFVSRGWRINAGQILKMAMQISELNLKDFSVLEDQLTGVDTAYFCQLLEKMREKDPTQVDSAYLVEIIDRIF